MTTTKLRVTNASKLFGANGATVEALRDISFDVEDKQFVSIIGRSGCGKTTLLRIVAGLEAPSGGEVLLQKDGRLTAIARPGPDRGMVFQEHYLFPWRSARRNIEFGLESKGVPAERRAQIVDEYLKLVHLDGFGDRYPSELSGGMRQRVAIARALATDPEVLLLDEPFASLDALTRMKFQDELLRIWELTRKTIILVTHNIDDAVYLSDRIVVLKPHPGEIRQIINYASPRPRSRSSADFVEMVARLESLIGVHQPGNE